MLACSRKWHRVTEDNIDTCHLRLSDPLHPQRLMLLITT